MRVDKNTLIPGDREPTPEERAVAVTVARISLDTTIALTLMVRALRAVDRHLLCDPDEDEPEWDRTFTAVHDAMAAIPPEWLGPDICEDCGKPLEPECPECQREAAEQPVTH